MSNSATKTKPAKVKKNSQVKQILKRLFSNKGAVVGLVILLVILILAASADLIAPYDYKEMDTKNKLATPSVEHLFGTDNLGRDLFSRVLYGSRYSLLIGFSATILAVVIGVAIGSICGYFGGWLDDIVMRLIDIIQAVPNMLLAILVAASLGTGLVETIFALAVSNIPQYVRIIRGSILSIRKMEYLDAAIVDNTSTAKIILKHLIPNAFAPVIVQATLGMAHVITSAAGLSFIGLGVPSPAPEWGALLSGARSFIRGYPHMIIFPGLALMLTVLSLNLMGDGLRDALDPKMKK